MLWRLWVMHLELLGDPSCVDAGASDAARGAAPRPPFFSLLPRSWRLPAMRHYMHIVYVRGYFVMLHLAKILIHPSEAHHNLHLPDRPDTSPAPLKVPTDVDTSRTNQPNLLYTHPPCFPASSMLHSQLQLLSLRDSTDEHCTKLPGVEKEIEVPPKAAMIGFKTRCSATWARLHRGRTRRSGRHAKTISICLL